MNAFARLVCGGLALLALIFGALALLASRSAAFLVVDRPERADAILHRYAGRRIVFVGYACASAFNCALLPPFKWFALQTPAYHRNAARFGTRPQRAMAELCRVTSLTRPAARRMRRCAPSASRASRT